MKMQPITSSRTTRNVLLGTGVSAGTIVGILAALRNLGLPIPPEWDVWLVPFSLTVLVPFVSRLLAKWLDKKG